MAYTPELSQKHSCTLKRIAWALDKPMTKAIEEVFDHIGKTIDNRKVCKNCRDQTRCHDCAFNRNLEQASRVNAGSLFNAKGGVK